MVLAKYFVSLFLTSALSGNDRTRRDYPSPSMERSRDPSPNSFLFQRNAFSPVFHSQSLGNVERDKGKKAEPINSFLSLRRPSPEKSRAKSDILKSRSPTRTSANHEYAIISTPEIQKKSEPLLIQSFSTPDSSGPSATEIPRVLSPPTSSTSLLSEPRNLMTSPRRRELSPCDDSIPDLNTISFELTSGKFDSSIFIDLH
jgi:hypothetical protein